MNASNSKLLPIEKIKLSLLSALKQSPTVLLTAPPGAGKSTCLPLWLLNESSFANKIIYMLQPRRIAAKNVATFLAKQLGETVGETVGYQLRNDSKISKKTRLFVITEGLLTQVIQQDPELAECGLIIFDEFHERSLHADLAFALARDIQQGLRDDLSLLLMSATLAADAINAQLPDAISLACEGRSYPVEIEYKPAQNPRNWRQHATDVIENICQQHQGSVLVFLPGVADIKAIANHLENSLPSHFQLAPLYGGLSLTEQQLAINLPQAGKFKLVLSTNIAETSLTIDGVNLVIDCGFEKVAVFDANTLSNNLQQRNIAKDSAIQRAGRAGRLMPGKCIRLYAQEDFSRRGEHSESEIKQADIQPLVFEAARWGVKSLNELPMLELPPALYEKHVWQELQTIDLLDEKRRLTEHGEEVAQLSCHPRFAHMIIKAKKLQQQGSNHLADQTFSGNNLSFLACILASLLEERDIFSRDLAIANANVSHRIDAIIHHPKKLNHQGILRQANRLASHARIPKLALAELPNLLNGQDSGVLLALAYPERIAMARNNQGDFISVNGKGIKVNYEDPLANEKYLVAAQLQQHKQILHVSLAAPVDLDALIARNIVKVTCESVLHYDDKNDRIISAEQTRIGAITLSQKPSTLKEKPTQVAQLWCEQVTKKGLAFLNWSHDDIQLLERWRWLNINQSHLGLPDASEVALLTNLTTWFAPFVENIRNKSQLTKLDLSTMLKAMLDYSQLQQLDKYAPKYFIGPTKRKCPIRYSQTQAPIVSLPMQELYGVSQTPVVGDAMQKSQVALIIEILSPAKRPIQVTQNLMAFWQGSYKAVQKDMKSQYPKHYWPDDPANAQATRKTKRHINE